MKLTKSMRESILHKAIANVPAEDHIAKLVPIVQSVLRKHAPATVKKVIDDPDCHKYLKQAQIRIKEGNRILVTIRDANISTFVGVTTDPWHAIDIRCDQTSFESMKEGTLNYDLSKAVIESGLVEKYQEQIALLNSVQARLKATLNSVTTVKRLYDVLEPELHHLIPKEDARTANLPAAAAPVVDDLRRLGAELPEVAKAS